ncbi:GEVED domain-containing protein [Chitinophagaceae bacterium MMS25-I14]
MNKSILKPSKAPARRTDPHVVQSWLGRMFLFFALSLAAVQQAQAYCTTGLGGGSSPSTDLVQILGTTLNNPTPGSASGYYTAYPATGSTTATLFLGQTYILNTVYGSGAAIASVWIDYDQNGTFDASEWQQITTNATSASISLNIPATALTGTTTMRIRSRAASNLNGATDACTSFGSGETEDYIITLANPVPCSGMPVAGTAVALNAAVCYAGTTSIYLDGSSQATGLTYQWQYFDGTTWQTTTTGSGSTTMMYTTGNLTAATQFRCAVTCGASTAYSAPVTINVNAAGLPYTEDFESIANDNDLPGCMTATNLGNNVTTYTAPTGWANQINHTPGGSKFASFSWNSNDYIFTPAFNLTAGQTYRISFWYITDGYSGWNTLNAAVGTSPTIPGMTPLSVVVNNPTNTTYQQYVATFTATTTDVYYFGIYCNAGFNPSELSIDDINIVLLPPCAGTPTAGTAVATPAAPCYNTGTTLTLSGSSIASGLSYQWQYYDGTSFVDVTTGTGGTTDIYTTDPLTATTIYRCKVICTNTSSAPVYSTPDTVVVAPATLPYTEDFESIATDNEMPGCMTATNINNYVYTYTSPSGFANMDNHTPGGSKYACFGAGCNDYIYSPAFNLVAGKTYQVTFWYVTDGYGGWTSLQAFAGTSATASAMINPVGAAIAPPANTNYEIYMGTFVAPTSDIYYFGINCQASWNPYRLTLDDINIIELPPCSGTPAAGTVTPAGPLDFCSGSTVHLKTVGTTPAANLTYQWIQSSASNPAWVNAVGSGNNTLFFNTAPLTDTMYYRMVVKCVNSGLSDTTAIDTIRAPRQQYASLPVTEDFESWVSRCDVDDAPSIDWTNMPATGDNSWRRNDEGTAGNWNSPSYAFYYPYSAHGNYSARFHGGNLWPAGITGNLDLFVDCSTSASAKELQFFYINDSGNDSLNVLVSEDGGATFTNIGAFNTGNGWTYTTLPITSVSPTTIIRFTGVSDGNGSDIGLDYVRVLEPCAATPVAGTIVPVTPCPNTDFNLFLNGTSASSGLTYQWQRLLPTGVWQTVGTQMSVTQNIGTATYYRCIVTCTASAASDTSPVYQVQLSTFLYCYCIPTYTWGGDYDNITNVQLKNLNNNSANSGNNYPYYSDYSSQQPATLPIPVLVQGDVDTLTVDFGSDWDQYCGVWIDFNRNGNFDTSEYFTTGANAGPNGTLQIPLSTPISNISGITRMRIRGGDNQQMLNTQACGATNSSYGETEDYLVEIQYRPCDGPANAGTAKTSDTAMCPGYPIQLIDTTHEYTRTGLAWNWESSTDNGNTWTTITGSLNRDTVSPVFNGPTWYRLKMLCSNTLDSTYSNILKINIKPAYKCYCFSMANGGVNDSTDIGAFSIGNYVFSTGGPHIKNGSAVHGRTDNTDYGPIVLYIDSTYEVDVYQILRSPVHADTKVTFFMDFNNNLQYDVPTERLITEFTSVQNWYLTANITIPQTVIPEVPTGMRVVMNDNVNANVPSDEACGAYTSGETEDYTVIFRKATGITHVSNLKDLLLYPNPTTGKFAVQLSVDKPVGSLDIEVTNVTGQQVMVQHYSDITQKFSAELDMSTQAKGVYFVQIKGDKEIVTRKLIVR